MILIPISGPCGVGKSTLIERIQRDFDFLDIIYKDCEGANLNPETYESKVDYVQKWFSQVKWFNNENTDVIFSDRSPFDCLAYLKEREEQYAFEINIRFEELVREGVQIYPVLLTANIEVLKERILSRFTSGSRSDEIYRNEIKELKNSLDFYKKQSDFFELILDNSHMSVLESEREIAKFAKGLSIDKG